MKVWMKVQWQVSGKAAFRPRISLESTNFVLTKIFAVHESGPVQGFGCRP